jgi:hypothetical protein
MARCVLRSRAAMLNAVVGPVLGATTGAEWKGHSVSGSGKAARKKTSTGQNHRVWQSSDAPTPEAKDKGLMNALSRAGFAIR